MKSKIFICFVTALVFFGLLASIGNIDSKKVETKQSEGPHINFVNMTHPYEQHIDNNSIVYICEKFNITINVTDKNKLSTMVITYDGNEIVHDLGGEYQVEIEQPIFISGPGVYEVSIMVNNTAGYETWYFFTVICCDDKPPIIRVYEGQAILLPEQPMYRCENTTVHVVVSSADGLDVVVITIKHNGHVIWSETYDLSTDDIDTSFDTHVTIPITAPGTYQLEIYAMDLCQYDEELTYLFVCEYQDMPPEILRVMACEKQFIMFNECVCCCNFTLDVYAIDDYGIVLAKTYIDDAPYYSESYSPPLIHIHYTHNVMITTGIHQVKIVVWDTSGYTDIYIFYVICDFTPPTINVYINDTAIENDTTITISGDIVSITVTGSDNVGIGKVEIYAGSMLIGEYEYECPPESTGYNITMDINVTRYMAGYIDISRPVAKAFLEAKITIVVYDLCGNKSTFTFTIKKSVEYTIAATPEPEDILFSAKGAGIVIGMGFATAIVTVVAFSFIRRQPVG